MDGTNFGSHWIVLIVVGVIVVALVVLLIISLRKAVQSRTSGQGQRPRDEDKREIR